MNSYLSLFLFFIFAITFNNAEAVSKVKHTNEAVKLFSSLGDAPLSRQFEVKIDGKKASVEKMAKFDIPIHYVQMTYNESKKVEVEITVDQPIKSYTISPISKHITGKKTGNKLSFWLEKSNYLIVKINEMENLFLLIDTPANYKGSVKSKGMVNINKFGIDNTGAKVETRKLQAAIDEVAAKKGVLYFPKGIYRTGQLNIRNNSCILLDNGALICGSINPADYTDKALIRLDGVSDCKLMGNGTIDGSGWAGLRKKGVRDCYLIFASNCKNITVDGLVLRDPTFWNTRIYRSSSVFLKNIKILNNRPVKNWTNTDGVDFDSSIDCSLINAVIHAGDDNVVVKGLDSERKFTTEHLLLDGVLTLSNSAATKIGTETCVKQFNDIVFRNMDIVKCKRAMVINGFDSTTIQNVKFENINIESFDFNGTDVPRLVDFEITNNSWRQCDGRCTIKNVDIINVTIFCDIQGVISQLLGQSTEFGISNVQFDNILIKNKPARKLEDIKMISNKYVQNITFK